MFAWIFVTVPGQGRVGGGQHLRQGVDLIPEGVGVDLQAFPSHDAHLPLQWQTVQVLLGGDLDGELSGA
jgi:hypothetical protein